MSKKNGTEKISKELQDKMNEIRRKIRSFEKTRKDLRSNIDKDNDFSSDYQRRIDENQQIIDSSSATEQEKKDAEKKIEEFGKKWNDSLKRIAGYEKELEEVEKNIKELKQELKELHNKDNGTKAEEEERTDKEKKSEDVEKGKKEAKAKPKKTKSKTTKYTETSAKRQITLIKKKENPSQEDLDKLEEIYKQFPSLRDYKSEKQNPISKKTKTTQTPQEKTAKTEEPKTTGQISNETIRDLKTQLRTYERYLEEIEAEYDKRAAGKTHESQKATIESYKKIIEELKQQIKEEEEKQKAAQEEKSQKGKSKTEEENKESSDDKKTEEENKSGKNEKQDDEKQEDSVNPGPADTTKGPEQMKIERIDLDIAELEHTIEWIKQRMEISKAKDAKAKYGRDLAQREAKLEKLKAQKEKLEQQQKKSEEEKKEPEKSTEKTNEENQKTQKSAEESEEKKQEPSKSESEGKQEKSEKQKSEPEIIEYMDTGDPELNDRLKTLVEQLKNEKKQKASYEKELKIIEAREKKEQERKSKGQKSSFDLAVEDVEKLFKEGKITQVERDKRIRKLDEDRTADVLKKFELQRKIEESTEKITAYEGANAIKGELYLALTELSKTGATEAVLVKGENGETSSRLKSEVITAKIAGIKEKLDKSLTELRYW